MAQRKTTSRELLADEEFGTVREVERLTRSSHSTIYRKIREGELETVKVGNRTLIRMDSVRRMLGHETAA